MLNSKEDLKDLEALDLLEAQEEGENNARALACLYR